MNVDTSAAGATIINNPEPPALPDTCSADPNPEVAVAHAVPHAVVSQVLRDDVAAFIPPDTVMMRSVHDAQCCVSEVTIKSSVPEAIEFAAKLPHLTALRGFKLKNEPSNSSCAPVAQLTQLRELEFGDCDTTTVGPDFFAVLPNLTELRELRLWTCPGVNAESMAEIVKLTRLELLDISSCEGVDAAAFSLLPTLKHLRVLHIQRCDIDATSLALLPDLLQLRSLTIWGSGSSQCFGEIAHIPQLEELEIGYCSSEEFNADVVRALSQRSTLTALDATFCDGFDDECLALLANLPDLRRLTVSYCDDVKRDGICHIATRMPTLRHLDLSCNDYVNSDTFAKIAQKLPLLESLFIRYCPGVDADTLQFVSDLPRLRLLDVIGCEDVDSEAVACLYKSPRLKTLWVSDNDELTEALAGMPSSVEVIRKATV